MPTPWHSSYKKATRTRSDAHREKALLVVSVIVLAVVGGGLLRRQSQPAHYQAPSGYACNGRTRPANASPLHAQGTLVGATLRGSPPSNCPSPKNPSPPPNTSPAGFLVDPQQKASDLNPATCRWASASTATKTGTRYHRITCAACHTGLNCATRASHFTHHDVAAMHSIAACVPTLRGGAFDRALGASIAATTTRSSSTASPGESSANAEFQNRVATARRLQAVLDTLLRTAPAATSAPEGGPGRTDAFGRIANTSSAMPSTRATTASPTPR